MTARPAYLSSGETQRTSARTDRRGFRSRESRFSIALTAGENEIGISALGPSTKKADYSNYGVEQISLSAPGGWFRDGFGTATYRTNGNLILSTYPLHILQHDGLVDPAGTITPAGIGAGVQKDCDGQACGYYAPLQGTSMASPHATGVAALAVSRFGVKDPAHKGTLRLAPWKTEFILVNGAAGIAV